MNRKNIELRDWYAGLAMQSLVASYNDATLDPVAVAVDAFEVASEMMAQREREMGMDGFIE